MHFMITSRRCIPASRASSVGVKWIAMYLSSLAGCLRSVLRLDPDGATLSPLFASNGVRNLDEPVPDAEALRQQLPEPADTEGLAGVVAAGEEVDRAFPGVGHHVFGRLARDVGVESQGDCLVEDRAAASGHDADPPDLCRSRVEDERLRAEQGGAPVDEFADRQWIGGRADAADRRSLRVAEGRLPGEAEPLADQRVVPNLGVRVEGEVVGGEAHVGVEQQLEPRLELFGDGAGALAPEDSVMA